MIRRLFFLIFCRTFCEGQDDHRTYYLTLKSLEEKQQVEELDCIANRFDDRVEKREEESRKAYTASTRFRTLSSYIILDLVFPFLPQPYALHWKGTVEYTHHPPP